MFRKLMRQFQFRCNGRKTTANGSIRIETLNNLAKVKKTRVFTDLDSTKDEDFGKLIRELAKE